jgi:epoxyqueuosine reductase
MMRIPMDTLETRLKARAKEIGFDLVGIAPATEADGFQAFQNWLRHGFAGEMTYMHRHAEARRHPASVLPTVRSVIMVAISYHEKKPEDELPELVGRVARYARGEDYHHVLRRKLKQLLKWLEDQCPNCRGRAVVDTAPLLERDFARRAGLGWIGKNTMLITKRAGSYLFLGALLVDIPLQADTAHDSFHCGTCRACLDACPTEAFPEPGMLDARRCISYWTIESRGPLATEDRERLHGWVFGCDVCQEVCPWNRKATPGAAPELRARPELTVLSLVEVLGLTDDEFRKRFRGTAILRAGRAGLVRNAALCLGASGDGRAIAALRRAANDPDPVARDAVGWALERLTSSRDA